MDKKQCQKKVDFFCNPSATNSSGMNPKKMSNVNGDTGHAAKSNNPENMLALIDIVFFKTFFLRGGSSE
jgi:hypothetical protein